MPSDQGRFEGGILPSTRYFFNSVSGRCEPFIYRGTGGNANNFLTEAQCQSYCTVGELLVVEFQSNIGRRLVSEHEEFTACIYDRIRTRF